MEHLLFAGYLCLFAWLITRTPFFKNAGLTAPQLVMLFLMKVMAGIFYGWVGVYYGDMARMVDTWAFHYESLREAQLLLHDPLLFFQEIAQTSYADGYGGFLGSEKTWWNDLDVNLFQKLIGIFSTASFGHYYVNVIFYSYLSFFGPIAFYRVAKEYFPGREGLALAATFFIPSFLFWTSGLHKEGLIFNSIALCIFYTHRYLKYRKLGWKAIVIVMLNFVLLLVFRNYLALLLVPALLAWLLAGKLFQKPMPVFVSVYLVCMLVFFGVRHIDKRLDFPAAVADKQAQFSRLSGNSEIPMQKLSPNAGSFIANMPQAFSHTLLRPFFTDIHHLLSLAASLETNLLIFLFIMYVFYKRGRFTFSPFGLCCLFFSLTVLLFIGYTVNFMGAIVRYRSIVLPLLFLPVIVHLPWKEFGQAFLRINYKINV